MIMSLKQMKIKITSRIKLNHTIWYASLRIMDKEGDVNTTVHVNPCYDTQLTFPAKWWPHSHLFYSNMESFFFTAALCNGLSFIITFICSLNNVYDLNYYTVCSFLNCFAITYLNFKTANSLCGFFQKHTTETTEFKLVFFWQK